MPRAASLASLARVRCTLHARRLGRALRRSRDCFVARPRVSPRAPPRPLRARCDGWTVEKQYAFINAPAESGIVEFVAAKE